MATTSTDTLIHHPEDAEAEAYAAVAWAQEFGFSPADYVPGEDWIGSFGDDYDGADDER